MNLWPLWQMMQHRHVVKKNVRRWMKNQTMQWCNGAKSQLYINSKWKTYVRAIDLFISKWWFKLFNPSGVNLSFSSYLYIWTGITTVKILICTWTLSGSSPRCCPLGILCGDGGRRPTSWAWNVWKRGGKKRNNTAEREMCTMWCQLTCP